MNFKSLLPVLTISFLSTVISTPASAIQCSAQLLTDIAHLKRELKAEKGKNSSLREKINKQKNELAKKDKQISTLEKKYESAYNCCKGKIESELRSQMNKANKMQNPF